MSNKVDQLSVLLWKNWLVQRRKPAITAVEILLPTVFSLILVIIRQHVPSTRYDSPTAWPGFSVWTLNPTLGVCLPTCKLYFAPNASETAVGIMDRAQTILGNISGEIIFFF